MILHLVLYQPKATSTAEERGSLVAALEAACHEIPVIQQVRVGKAINLGMGYENRSLELKMEYAAIF